MELLSALAPATAAIVWIIASWAAFATLARYRRRRLLRCPESGAVAIADIEEKRAPGRDGARLSVTNCQLWPERADCGRGCLVRSAQARGIHGFDLAALRPFGEGELRKQSGLAID